MKRLTILLLLLLIGCSSPEKEVVPNHWPEKLRGRQIGLKVTHSVDTVYATLNTKDPEKWGTYQLQFSTTVEAMDEELEIVKFGGYLWENGKWVLRSIYDRPFNKDEFDKWYHAKNGKIEPGKKYTDDDNWLGKTNTLNGQTYKGFWYFIGKNEQGEKLVGGKEIIGVLRTKPKKYKRSSNKYLSHFHP